MLHATETFRIVLMNIRAEMHAENLKHTCRICANSNDNNIYHVKEMLYGSREPFEYFECSDCGCLQISEVPDDLGRYYPSNYLSFKNYGRRSRNHLRKIIDTARVGYELNGRGVLGRVAHTLLPGLDYVHWCQVAGIGREARILDVGCGAGKLLIRMMQGGFRRLEGADPFIDADIHYPGVTIHKFGLDELVEQRAGDFDFVMLHHSFEHMDQPVKVLRQVRELLAADGSVLIRIPVAGSYAWEHYRENWFAMDPPRHLYLHTQASMGRVTEEAGMGIFATEYDSTETQFTGSERYRRNLPMAGGPKQKQLFTRAEMAEFEKRSAALNSEGRGDQAAFYLRRC